MAVGKLLRLAPCVEKKAIPVVSKTVQAQFVSTDLSDVPGGCAVVPFAPSEDPADSIL